MRSLLRHRPRHRRGPGRRGLRGDGGRPRPGPARGRRSGRPGGVVGWAKTLAHELGPDGITVNTIAPGKIDTPRVKEVWQHQPDPEEARRRDMEAVPARRLGRPQEIGAMVAFLCSTQAAYVSGT